MAKAPKQSPSRMVFEKPPINELVIASYFPPVAQLRAEHVGLFWHTVRAEFPLSQQAPPLGDFAQLQSPEEFLPMPRFWLISQDETQLIQIQKSGFMLNWRRRPGAGIYPHFDTVYDRQQLLFERFRLFLGEALNVKIEQLHNLELTYINIIELPDDAKVSDIQGIIPSLAPIAGGPYRDLLKGINATFRFTIDDTLSVNVAVRNGKQSDKPGQILILEIKAYGLPKDRKLESSADWYEAAHAQTGKLFLAVTSEKARKDLWKQRKQ